jgi:hypothetical protein
VRKAGQAANRPPARRRSAPQFFTGKSGQRRDSQTSRAARKELAPSFVQNSFVGWMHDKSPVDRTYF